VKRPSELTTYELEALCQLIASGGEVRKDSLRAHLLEAIIVAYVVDRGRAVAVAAIKKPHDTSSDSAFSKAASEFCYEQFSMELGYVVVEPLYRGRGVASLLCQRLCEMCRSCGVYATVRSTNHVMQVILGRNGFVKTGKPFPSRNGGEDIELFVKMGTA